MLYVEARGEKHRRCWEAPAGDRRRGQYSGPSPDHRRGVSTPRPQLLSGSYNLGPVSGKTWPRDTSERVRLESSCRTDLICKSSICKSSICKLARAGPTYKLSTCTLTRSGPIYKSSICKLAVAGLSAITSNTTYVRTYVRETPAPHPPNPKF